jgi:starch synthase
LAYQGRFASSLLPRTGLGWELFSPKYLEFYGDINLMKAGIIFASKLNTVSETYAKEVQTDLAGHGLEGVLRTRTKDLTGIRNGVDLAEWNPRTDTRIKRTYDVDEMSGKAANKTALQERAKLPPRDVPVYGVVSRLVWDKGIPLLVSTIEQLLKADIQIVLLGSGDASFEGTLRQAMEKHPEKLSVTIGYDEDLAHQTSTSCLRARNPAA